MRADEGLDLVGDFPGFFFVGDGVQVYLRGKDETGPEDERARSASAA